MSLLGPILQEYLTTHLSTQRALSPATISTYRDTFRLLLVFLSTRTGRPAHTLDLADLEAGNVTAFLDHLEHERGNAIATRNLRLAAIKSLAAFQATRSPEDLGTITRIHAIPTKKGPKPQVTYLTMPQLQALLAAIDTTTWTGRRDHALFTLTAQTGLRISEVISLKTDSLHLGAAAHVSCTGKGRKRRTTPLTSSTAATLTSYLTERSRRPGNALFPNPRGGPLSPDAIQQRLRHHLATAAGARPELAGLHITVHTLRHTAAMRFLEAGIDAAVIALWLGHESTATTSIYLHADMNIKRRALDRTRQPEIPTGDYQPDDPLLAWLKSL